MLSFLLLFLVLYVKVYITAPKFQEEMADLPSWYIIVSLVPCSWYGCLFKFLHRASLYLGPPYYACGRSEDNSRPGGDLGDPFFLYQRHAARGFNLIAGLALKVNASGHLQLCSMLSLHSPMMVLTRVTWNLWCYMGCRMVRYRGMDLVECVVWRRKEPGYLCPPSCTWVILSFSRSFCGSRIC